MRALMAEWLAGNQAKLVLKSFLAILGAAFVVEQGIAIFGGAHAAFWHIAPLGYVQIKTVSKFSRIEFVKPWVATLHHWTVGIMLVSGGVILLLALAMRAAKAKSSA